MAKRVGFLPFPFRTTEDQIQLFSLLHVMRMDDYPVPAAASFILVMASDQDLRNYAEGIRDFCVDQGRDVPDATRVRAIEALDTLAYFHGLKCKGSSADNRCLGQEIEAMIEQFTP